MVKHIQVVKHISVESMNKNSLKGDAEWSCFTGKRAFEELQKVYDFLMNWPGCRDLYIINPIRNHEHLFSYVCNAVTMHVACRAEGLSLDQWNYVFELSKKFDSATRMKVADEDKVVAVAALKVQVKETMVLKMEEYQYQVDEMKKHRKPAEQNQDNVVEEIQIPPGQSQDGTMEEIQNPTEQNQDDTMEEI